MIEGGLLRTRKNQRDLDSMNSEKYAPNSLNKVDFGRFQSLTKGK